MPFHLPSTYRSLILKQSSQAGYSDVSIENSKAEPLKPGYVLVKLNAAAFNRRDHWIRLMKYPKIGFGSTMGSDGAGVVVASGDKDDELLNKRVFLTPMRGWDSHPEAPENPLEFSVIGGVEPTPLGTFAEYAVVERDQVIPSPDHLDDIHLAAWPTAGLTSWRAVSINAQIEAGQNVLITGIGGGVALVALQICVAKGANVYVTSSAQDRIDKAVSLGAKGGVSYKDDNWPQRLLDDFLSENSPPGKLPLLDCVIDSGGNDIMTKVGSILKLGGRVVCYGMTGGPKITFTMREVMKNQRLIGSTMGSRQDLIEATQFMRENKIIPVVSHIIDGLDSAEEGFQLLKQGEQMGKIVIKIQPGTISDSSAKL